MTREEAISILQSAREKYSNICIKEAFNMAIEGLKDRPHGEWVWKLDKETGESGWSCTVCNEFSNDKSPYCHICGADMRKEVTRSEYVRRF